MKRGMPFVFVTGYGEGSLPEAYRGRPALQKPFQAERLEQTSTACWRRLGLGRSSAAGPVLNSVRTSPMFGRERTECGLLPNRAAPPTWS